MKGSFIYENLNFLELNEVQCTYCFWGGQISDVQWLSFEILWQILSSTFWLFLPPSKQNFETNYISFKSPNVELSETEIKLGMASF